MKKEYLIETNMLNFHTPKITALINERKWKKLDDFNKIKFIYEYVQNDILFGYNSSDTLTAKQVLDDGIGQCNTKATLLMALLRAVNIPCRLHAFNVSKDFQRGATTWLISKLAPKYIIHTWVEVYYQNTWYALEGVITDKKYLHAIQTKFSNISGPFRGYAIATKNLSNPPVDWNCNHTYIQKEAIVFDYGIFSSPDIFFRNHRQHMSKVKNFFYSHIGSKIMTKNVDNIRNQ